MYIVVLFTGIILGMAITAMVSMDNANEKNNAEYRATIHLRKLQAIENIIKKDEEKHEFITETIKKIKEVITSDQTNK